MIDEKKLIEVLSKNSIFEKITNAEGKNIFEIIKEQPKTDWIPCEERLPSEYGQYFYTDKNDEVHEGTYCPPLQGMIRGWSTCEAEGYVKLSDDEVIAWTNRPQPYKKEGAENGKI